MDKITFESVMEEIKKSLGEARLMKIDEVDEPYKSTTVVPDYAKPEFRTKSDTQTVTNNDSMRRGGLSGAYNRASSSSGSETPAPAPVERPAPAPAPAPKPSLPSMAAQGPKLGTSTFQGSNTPEKPAPKPVDSSTQGTIDRMSTPGNAPGSGTSSVKSGVGGGNLGFGIKGPESGGKPVAPSAPAPAPKLNSYQPAPRTQGMTNQPAPSGGGNKYGYAASGSDDDTAANFFAASKRETADRGAASAPRPVAPKPVAPRPAAPRPVAKPAAPLPPRRPATREAGAVGGSNIAENFDQFVKKFIKESK